MDADFRITKFVCRHCGLLWQCFGDCPHHQRCECCNTLCIAESSARESLLEKALALACAELVDAKSELNGERTPAEPDRGICPAYEGGVCMGDGLCCWHDGITGNTAAHCWQLYFIEQAEGSND